jgi:hypothetical protein
MEFFEKKLAEIEEKYDKEIAELKVIVLFNKSAKICNKSMLQ